MNIGAQLYTLRDLLKEERQIRQSLAKVAKIGFRSVQVSGLGPIEPKTLRSICDDLGLSIIITHTPEARIIHETERVIEEHTILGANYIGLGAMSQQYRSVEGAAEFIKAFHKAARKISDAGKLFMYHNHNFEFEKFGGKLLFDYLTEGFAPGEMGFTLDTYWVQAGGGDVCQWIEKLSGRIPCIHLKDMTIRDGKQIMAPVMEGNMNFPAILKALERAGTEYAFIEQDTCEEDPFICLEKSYANLKKLGYQ